VSISNIQSLLPLLGATELSTEFIGIDPVVGFSDLLFGVAGFLEMGVLPSQAVINILFDTQY
jgi:hypothetical protein